MPGSLRRSGSLRLGICYPKRKKREETPAVETQFLTEFMIIYRLLLVKINSTKFHEIFELPY
jgi:hypothetical protein